MGDVPDDEMELMDMELIASMTAEERQLLEAVEASEEFDSLFPSGVLDDASEPPVVSASAPSSGQDSQAATEGAAGSAASTTAPSPSAQQATGQAGIPPSEDPAAKHDPVARLDLRMGETRAQSKWQIPEAARKALDAAQASAEASPCKAGPLHDAEERIKALVEEERQKNDQAALADLDAYLHAVLPWRVRGATVAETAAAKGRVQALEAGSLVQSFMRDESVAEVPLRFVPEINELRSQVCAYQTWVRTYGRVLPYLRAGRSGRRNTAIVGRLPLSKRMSWESFQDMCEKPKSDFPLLESDHLQKLRSLELLARRLPEGLREVVERSGGTARARPSTRVLEQHYQEVDEKCIAIDDIPVLLPGATDLFRLRDTRVWRQQARRALLHHNSRVPIASLDEGADQATVMAKLVWTDPADLTYEELQDLREAGHACGVPGLCTAKTQAPNEASGEAKPSAAAPDPSKEEALLAARVNELLDEADEARGQFQKVFARVAKILETPSDLSEGLPAAPAAQDVDEGIADLARALAQWHEQPAADAGSDLRPRGVWIPEVDQAHALQGFCEWHKTSRPVLDAIRPALADFLRSNSGRGAPPREVGEALEQLDNILSEGRRIGLGGPAHVASASRAQQQQPQQEHKSKASKAPEGPDEDAAAAARARASLITQELRAAQNLWDQVDTQLASEVERWRRSLVGTVVEVEWEAGDWYLAKVAAYRNLDKLHFVAYDTGEVEAILIKFDGEALSVDGEDRIAWRMAAAGRTFAVTPEREREFEKQIRDMTRQLDRERAKARKRGRKTPAPEDSRDLEFDRESISERGDAANEEEDGEEGDFQHLIVGDFIKVEWTVGEYWLGNVRKFEPSHGLHCVVYKEGNSEYMRLKEDGSAVSRDGSETFSWISTKEVFDIDENEPVPALEDDSSAYESEDDADDDDDDDSSDLEDARDKTDEDYMDPAGKKRKRRPSAEGAGEELKRQRSEGKTSSSKDKKKKSRKEKKRNKKEKKKKEKKAKKAKSKDRKKSRTEKGDRTGGKGRHIIKARVSSAKKPADPADWLAQVPRDGNPAAKDEVLLNKRKLARKVIRKIFESGTDGALSAGVEVLLGVLAKDLEQAIFDKCAFFFWDGGASRWRRRDSAALEYGQAVRTICTNLKQNKSLLQSVIDRKVSPVKLAHMRAADLAGDSIKQRIEREIREARESAVVIPTDVAATQNGQHAASKAAGGETSATTQIGATSATPAEASSADNGPGNESGSAADKKRVASGKSAVHPIDAKIAEAQAKAQRAKALLESGKQPLSRASSSGSQAQEEAMLPSLRDVLRDANADSEEAQNQADEGDRDGAAAGGGKPAEKLQRRSWQGSYRHEKAVLTLRPNSVVYGPGISVRKRLLPSVMLGLMGRQGQTLRLNGHMNPDKALAYLDTVATHAQSSRQFVVAEVQLGASRDDASAAWRDLVKINRVGIVEFGNRLQVYLVPPRAVTQFPQARSHIRSTKLGAAILVAKPAALPNLGTLAACEPLESESAPSEYVPPPFAAKTSRGGQEEAGSEAKSGTEAKSGSVSSLLAAVSNAARASESRPASASGTGGLQGLLSSIRKSNEAKMQAASTQAASSVTLAAPAHQQEPAARMGPTKAERDFIAQTASYCAQNRAFDGPSAYNLLAHRLAEYPFARHDHPDHGVFLHDLQYYAGQAGPPQAW